MEYDHERVDEMVLALLFLTSFQDGSVTRSWKDIDRDVLERLHLKGYISDLRSEAESVVLTEEGAAMSELLFLRYFELDPLADDEEEEEPSARIISIAPERPEPDEPKEPE